MTKKLPRFFHCPTEFTPHMFEPSGGGGALDGGWLPMGVLLLALRGIRRVAALRSPATTAFELNTNARSRPDYRWPCRRLSSQRFTSRATIRGGSSPAMDSSLVIRPGMALRCPRIMARYPALATVFASACGTSLYSRVSPAPALSWNDDFVTPGLKAVTDTPEPSSSRARPFESDNTYDFVA
jgi:hypothetical protein